MKGRVKWWSNDKGYGFIEFSENENLFVHLDEKNKQNYFIKDEQEIEFLIEKINHNAYLKILNIIEN